MSSRVPSVHVMVPSIGCNLEKVKNLRLPPAEGDLFIQRVVFQELMENLVMCR